MISRGQIHFVNLSPTQGREQAGRRPVLVVSSDAINRQPLVVTVVVGTDAKNVPREYPTNVRVSAKETSLPKDTVFLGFQIRSLDPSRFFDSKTGRLNLIGTMPPSRMREVESALKLVLNLIGPSASTPSPSQIREGVAAVGPPGAYFADAMARSRRGLRQRSHARR